jgi:ectoine hydroxylase-related dioxygenase (phytanoyl-CoA dioxygenase family)
VTAAHPAGTGTRPLTQRDCRLEDLVAVLGDPTEVTDYPHADTVADGVLVYDAAAALGTAGDERRALAAGLARALADGPGIVLFRGAWPDLSVVDRATAAFQDMIAEQRVAGSAVGDHFAPPGANDRVWNALEKLALRAPDVFVDYYANGVLALVATAWLGPGYQVTSQVNVVNPGGAAQVGHRDYHLGFLPAARIEQYPAHVHRLSPVLTLQGAVAHCDMPLESGPTLYLPHSQKYLPGYLATGRPEFREFFENHHVQLALRSGDAVFFNPAVIHAAGSNRSAGIRRTANLLQVSSAFGRAMESVDRERMCAALYPALQARAATGADVGAAVATAADGYAFPTDLDRDPPVGGLAPPTQADLVHRALAEGWDHETFRAELAAQAARRRSG